MGILFANQKVIQTMTHPFFSQHILCPTDTLETVDHRIKDHTDLGVFVGEKVVVCPEWFEGVVDYLSRYLSLEDVFEKVVCGLNHPSTPYPYDVSYNALQLSRHLFHLLSYTEDRVLQMSYGDKVAVRQGYTRCSVLPVGSQAAITEDKALYMTLTSFGYDVLFIPSGHVKLDGFSHGFIGGAGGCVDQTLILNGSLSTHPHGVEIRYFVERQGCEIIELHESQLVDCGSILYFNL